MRSALEDVFSRSVGLEEGAAVDDEDDIDILIAWRCSKAICQTTRPRRPRRRCAV